MIVPGITRSTRASSWIRALCAAVLGWLAGSAAIPARGDDFSRLVGAPLFEIPRATGRSGTDRLTVATIESLPEVVRGERSALILATTDQGNVAKLLVSPALRRRASGGDEAAVVPILSLDRFETIDRGDRVARKARGRDVVLFDRFEFDLDSGQVVPPGFGGDIAFSSTGKDGAALLAIGAGRLYAIDKPLSVPGSGPGRPSTGPTVLPSDFNGRYTLVSNGQMSGALELSVDGEGAVTGRFRSDRNGSLYPVSGRVAADLSRRIGFEIQFPRSKQVFDGLLWTEDRNVFAGTVQILDHPYSFVAVREGMPLVPEPIDATSPPRAPMALKASSRVVTLQPSGAGYALDGRSMSAEGLAAALEGARKGRDAMEVLIRVPPSTPFETVQRAVRIVRGAGVTTIRLAESETR